MSKIFVFLLMIFCHVIDDFKLQAGVLVNLKQSLWWVENVKPHELWQKCRFDYIMALIMHGFSWAFMIMLPVAFSMGFYPTGAFYVAFVINWAVHSFVDDLKANRFKINLIVDQTIHIVQIALTAWLLL